MIALTVAECLACAWLFFLSAAYDCFPAAFLCWVALIVIYRGDKP